MPFSLFFFAHNPQPSDAKKNVVIIGAGVAGLEAARVAIELVYDKATVGEQLTQLLQRKTTFGEIKNTIRDTLGPYFYQKTKRNPMIIPVIMNKKHVNRKL